ncbi:hypothetical protein M8818_000019 [Zalaria obscura]|uniref:Uncharacterized protein n=1 Tax=Zalaria obscura TaxID=2024903 RepID=A0ACC3SNY3_9PEZI
MLEPDPKLRLLTNQVLHSNTNAMTVTSPVERGSHGSGREMEGPSNLPNVASERSGIERSRQCWNVVRRFVASFSVCIPVYRQGPSRLDSPLLLHENRSSLNLDGSAFICDYRRGTGPGVPV